MHLRGRNAEAQNNLGLSYFESGQFDKALECFEQALASDQRVVKNAMYACCVHLRLLCSNDFAFQSQTVITITAVWRCIA